MNRWEKKVAIVTGASSGIGEAIAVSLVKHGMEVAGLARREERLQELKKKLLGYKGKFHPIKCDLREEDDILFAFKWVDRNLGGVHVLVNNAGTAGPGLLAEQETSKWKQIYDLNVLALQISSREALKSMKTHGITDGHIINISSSVAHINPPYPKCAAYFASKKAVNTISEGLRAELISQTSDIRVSVISPAIVETEIYDVIGMPVSQEVFDLALKSSDVAETVIFVLQLPKHVTVSEIVLQNTRDPMAIVKDLV